MGHESCTAAGWRGGMLGQTGWASDTAPTRLLHQLVVALKQLRQGEDPCIHSGLQQALGIAQQARRQGHKDFAVGFM